MTAQIIFDQVGLGAGAAGKSRSDGLANGATVTVTNASGNPCRVEWWWYPPDDTGVAATLVQNDDDEWQFDPTAARYGEYAVRMIEDEGLETETEDIKSFGIRLPTSNLLIPAFNSRGDYSVNRSSTAGAKTTAAQISFNNEPLPDDAGVNWANWWQSMNELFKYVEGLSPVVAVGIDPKESVRAVATSNVASLNGLAVTVDGVDLDTVDMRVLLTAQSDATDNGIWLVKSGAWQRPLDFAAGANVASAFTFVEEGTTYADTGWVCTTDQPDDEVDADNLAWSQFTGGSGGETLQQTLALGNTTGPDDETAGTNPIVISDGDHIRFSSDADGFTAGDYRVGLAHEWVGAGSNEGVVQMTFARWGNSGNNYLELGNVLDLGVGPNVRLKGSGSTPTVLEVKGSGIDVIIATGDTFGLAGAGITNSRLMQVNGSGKVVTITPATTQANLTDSTGGSADGTLSAVSGSGDDANINNNFAELAAKVNALLTAAKGVELIASS